MAEATTTQALPWQFWDKPNNDKPPTIDPKRKPRTCFIEHYPGTDLKEIRVVREPEAKYRKLSAENGPVCGTFLQEKHYRIRISFVRTDRVVTAETVKDTLTAKAKQKPSSANVLKPKFETCLTNCGPDCPALSINKQYSNAAEDNAICILHRATADESCLTNGTKLTCCSFAVKCKNLTKEAICRLFTKKSSYSFVCCCSNCKSRTEREVMSYSSKNCNLLQAHMPRSTSENIENCH